MNKTKYIRVQRDAKDFVCVTYLHDTEDGLKIEYIEKMQGRASMLDVMKYLYDRENGRIYVASCECITAVKLLNDEPTDGWKLIDFAGWWVHDVIMMPHKIFQKEVKA